MSFSYNCIGCNVNHAIKIINLLKLPENKSGKIIREVLRYLSEVDYQKCNPEIAGGVWEIVSRHTGDNDPYREIKAYYNRELLTMYAELSSAVEGSDNKFDTALKMAIAGNLIDFAAKHSFDMNSAKRKIAESKDMELGIDHSKDLYDSLKKAGTLFYLGDNCGEIVLDKLFIEYIKREFPGLLIYYGVRGRPAGNDITVADAEMTGMGEIATVIDNGDSSPGTVLSRVSGKFRELFYAADVVISKGQGNYESLSSADRGNIFFLFMSKCEAVAESLGVNMLAILCAGKGI